MNDLEMRVAWGTAAEKARVVELVESADLTELREMGDRAEALRMYAKRADDTGEVARFFCGIALRVMYRMGELLGEMPKNPGGRSTADRLSEVGIPHHQSSRCQRLASIPRPLFEDFLRTAPELTKSGALKLAKRATVSAVPADQPAPASAEGTYPTIVIDPPWRYDNVATRGAAEDHYPTMSLEELAELELPAADDAHIYLWVTNGFIREGFDLLDAWGFTYKTTLTWCKPQIGMGNWFRNSTEHVLFGVRGKLPTQRNDVPTWFLANRTKHSAKPESFYDLVESCSPSPWFEMFARRKRLGDWHVWGNEA